MPTNENIKPDILKMIKEADSISIINSATITSKLKKTKKFSNIILANYVFNSLPLKELRKPSIYDAWISSFARIIGATLCINTLNQIKDVAFCIGQNEFIRNVMPPDKLKDVLGFGALDDKDSLLLMGLLLDISKAAVEAELNPEECIHFINFTLLKDYLPKVINDEDFCVFLLFSGSSFIDENTDIYWSLYKKTKWVKRDNQVNALKQILSVLLSRDYQFEIQYLKKSLSELAKINPEYDLKLDPVVKYGGYAAVLKLKSFCDESGLPLKSYSYLLNLMSGTPKEKSILNYLRNNQSVFPEKIIPIFSKWVIANKNLLYPDKLEGEKDGIFAKFLKVALVLNEMESRNIK